MKDKWRDMETGSDSPRIVNAVIENPRRTENKYEYDVEKGEIVLDRVLHTAVHYPGDYGFLPRTFDEDGDPTDILVLVTNPTFPGCIMEARPLGILEMLDTGQRDDKILAVPLHDCKLHFSSTHFLRKIIAKITHPANDFQSSHDSVSFSSLVLTSA